MAKIQPRMTPPKFRGMKKSGKKITVLTAYDYPSARLLDAAGVDAILVGDSLGNVVQGKETTLPVTLDEMIYHGEMVARACKRALVIVDLPFPYCQSGPKLALQAAARILKETGADAVKIEGGEKRFETLKIVAEAGIPVMGHCGLKPQDVLSLGGYRVERDIERLLRDLAAVEKAGAFGVVLECITRELGEKATAAVEIPTIGIGAGNACDGQVLVFHDFLGFAENAPPKHVKMFADLRETITQAVQTYCAEVRDGTFPGEENSF